jgi:SSS family solute:Na+ symporter
MEQFLHLFSLGSSEGSSMWRALIAFCVCFTVSIVVSLFTRPKLETELKGLVYSLTPKVKAPPTAWYKRPLVLTGAAIVIFIVLNVIFF